jgi:hypothetical protein
VTRRLKPLAKALRGPVLVGRQNTTISRSFEEELFRRADVLSEGGCRSTKGALDCYFGSTMISFDLSSVRAGFRGDFDDATRAALLRAIDGSVRIRLRAMRLACAEAARRVPDRVLGTALTEIRVRLSNDQLHIDVDLEVPLGVSSRSRQG